MTFPNFPTDSMYKFLAISGIAIIIFSSYFIVTRMDDYNEKAYRIMEDAKDVNINIEIARFLTDSLRKQLTREDSIRVENLYKKSELLKYQSNIHNVKYNQLNKENNLFYALISLGTIISFIGFYFWYYRVQLPVDKMVRLDTFNKGIVYNECQSCGLDFNIQNIERGNEQSGEKNKEFCNNCYNDGSFTNPELRFEEMRCNLKGRLQELRYNKIFIWYSIIKLRRLKRWKKGFHW